MESFSQDTMVESSQGIPHLWRNVESGPLRILVMKLTRPVEGSKLK